MSHEAWQEATPPTFSVSPTTPRLWQTPGPPCHHRKAPTTFQCHAPAPPLRRQRDLPELKLRPEAPPRRPPRLRLHRPLPVARLAPGQRVPRRPDGDGRSNWPASTTPPTSPPSATPKPPKPSPTTSAPASASAPTATRSTRRSTAAPPSPPAASSWRRSWPPRATIVHCPGGGTHHGRPDRASGFCFLNDPVLGLLTWLDLGLDNIVYLDIDAHHGDGVQDAFHDDPRVFTISLHEASPLAVHRRRHRPRRRRRPQLPAARRMQRLRIRLCDGPRRACR